MADSRINASYTVTDATGKKSTKSLTDLSPSASGTQIKNLVEGLVSLTTNTLSQIERVETTDITSGGKPVPTFEYSSETPDGKISIATAYAQMTQDDMNVYLVNFTSNDVTFDDKQAFSVLVKSDINYVGAYCSYSKMGALPGKFVLGVMVAYKSDDPLLTAGDAFTVLIPETATTAATELVFTVVE